MTIEEIISEGIDLNDDVIEHDGDGIVYNGILYTGLGYELYPNGNLQSLQYYKDGFKYGICKRWYENGPLKEKLELMHGQVTKKTIFYADGKAKSKSIYEFGTRIKHKEWDKNGQLIINTIVKDERTWQYIKKRRLIYKGEFDDELKYVLKQIADKNIDILLP